MTRLQMILAGVGVAVLLVGLFVFRTLSNAGYFTEIEELNVLKCRAKTGIVGAEDILYDRASGLVFLSSTDRRAVLAGQENVRGEIFALHRDDLGAPFMSLTGGMPEEFQPHGISLWTSPNGAVKRLFAISHDDEGGSSVEIFDIEEGPRLVHRRSVRDEMIFNPNDLQAVGPDSFYVTNDHRYNGGLGALAENFLQMPFTNLVYFDGERAREAAGDMNYPNGVALSQDGEFLFVSHTLTGNLSIFRRDAETGDLSQNGLAKKSIKLGTGLDNIDVDESGALWITAHPKLFTFLGHVKDADSLSPTRVMRVTLNPETGVMQSEDIVVDSGRRLSGGSVGVDVDGTLLIGSVFEEKIAVCEL